MRQENNHFSEGHVGITCLAIAASSLFLAQSSFAVLVNLTTSTSFGRIDNTTSATSTQTVARNTYIGTNNSTNFGAVVNGALLLPSGSGAGSGTYRRLFALDQGGSQIIDLDGYNRDLPNNTPNFNSKVPNGFDPLLTVGQLVANNGYYQFSLDINEANGGNNAFLSVDEFQVYVEPINPGTDPSPLPSTVGTLGDLGTKIWDLQANNTSGSRIQVMAEGSGSGVDDVNFLIPISLFSGYSPNAYVYIFSKLAGLGSNPVTSQLGSQSNDTGFTYNGFRENAGGFEEFATPNAGFIPTPFPPPAVPEVSGLLPLIVLISGAALGVRFRPKHQRIGLCSV